MCTLLAFSSASAFAEEATPAGGAAFVEPTVSAPGGAFAGRPTHVIGRSGNGAEQIAIEARPGDAPWQRIATATTDGRGSFDVEWTPPKAGRYEFRLTPAGNAARTSSAPDTGNLTVYRRQKATWYGPGFYGKRTACGQKLTKRLLGVAHRSLPCGTQVELYSAGRTVTVPVIDRGPFVRGVSWDLTFATAKRLGTPQTLLLGALAIR